MKVNYQIYLIIISFIFVRCESPNPNYKQVVENPELFQSVVKNLTDIIVYDIFSPPVASRVYMYPTLGAYEIIALSNPDKYKSLHGQVKDFPKIESLPKGVDPQLSALHVYNIIGKYFIFSEDKMLAFTQKFQLKLDKIGIPSEVEKASLKYAQSVAKIILEWSNKDYYNQTRTFPKYTIREGEQYWKPTPPDYMDGIEPHWSKIRTLVIDSASQFSPVPPLAFDMKKGSPFQKQLEEVQLVGDNLDEEQTEIAKFWDCNPFVTHHRGHAMFATKKITPGGHWIGITAIATRQAQSSFNETVNAYTLVSVALFDSFISCWTEKWNSLLVRPETLINQYYDDNWMPLLQTPPFPEYTSGHSVISRASAVALTSIFGDNFKFKDTTEIQYGLPPRKFNSFIQASEEAAVSRLYGGIHYRMAVDEGVSQGHKVGEFIVNKLETKIKDNSN